MLRMVAHERLPEHTASPRELPLAVSVPEVGSPMSSRSAVGLLLFISLIATSPAFAYVDPNAGGLLFQLLTPLLALAAAGAAFARRQLARAWQMFSGGIRSCFDRLFRASGREVE
jgi:hypothetical protein